MKLYFSPGACSLSPHIVLREAKLKFDLEKVDTKAQKTASGEDYSRINPKGAVPAIKLDNGQVLTEGPAIVQYIADQAPNSNLIPKAGTFERYKVQEWLNFITSEIHKGFSPLFRKNTPDDYKPIAQENLAEKFSYLEPHLAKNKYLTGDQFTVADAYLFVTVNWANVLQLDLSRWPALQAFLKRVAERPAVQEAMKAEGLIK
jgi:glutathione S-transferase